MAAAFAGSSSSRISELFALGDQVTDFIEQLVRGHGRTKPRGDRLRFVRSQEATPRGQFDASRGAVVPVDRAGV
jgi:hypothetical protein